MEHIKLYFKYICFRIIVLNIRLSTLINKIFFMRIKMKVKVLLVLATLASYTLYSKDGIADTIYKKYNGFSVELGGSFLSGMSGGCMGLGYSIYSKKNFFVRNNVRVDGLVMKGAGAFSIREQIQIGGISLLPGYGSNTGGLLMGGIRNYILVDFGFLAFSGEQKPGNPFRETYLLEGRAGIGFEYISSFFGSWFVEGGGGGRFLTKGKLKDYTSLEHGFGFVEFGARYYF